MQLLMMIVMMACPSLIRNSTPLIKGPGAPVLMAAGPSPPESDSRRGEVRRHPWHTPVDRATKQKRVTLAPPPPVPLSSLWVPQTRPILLPSYPSHPNHHHKNHNTHSLLLSTHTHAALLRFPLSFSINFTNQLISLFPTHPPGVALSPPPPPSAAM